MDEPVSPKVVTRVSETKQEFGRQFELFATMFALASLLTAWQRIEVTVVVAPWDYAISALTAATAIVSLLRLKWTFPLVVLSLLHITHAILRLPLITSADSLWFFFGLTICCSFLHGWITNRSYDLCGVGLYRSFAPSLRIIFVLALASLGVARLNTSFIDAAVSPITLWLDWLRGGESSHRVIIYLAMSTLLVMELALAAALLVPSLRRFAVGVGSTYVAFLALLQVGEAYTLFSVMLLGFGLFTSTALVERIYETCRRWIPFPIVRLTGLGVISILAVAATFVAWSQQQPEGGNTFASPNYVMRWYGLLLASLWLISLGVTLIDTGPKLTWVALLPRNSLHVAILGVFVVFVLSPYLGFGAAGRFVEFSGLTTGGGANNHLLIPQAYLVDYEQDLVSIVGSSDTYLQEISDAGLQIPWIELVNYVEPRPDTSLTFIRANQRYVVERAGDITELSTQNSWLIRKLFAYPLVAPLPVDATFASTGR